MASAPCRRRSVLVVDDSPFIRRVVADVIRESEDFRLAGEAADGHEALGLVHELAPDVVTLDVHMPKLDGLATLGYLMSEAPRPVVMLSALDDGGETTMRALELGAVDFVRKPSVGDSLDLSTLRERLLGALRTAVGARYRSIPVLARPVRAPAGAGGTPAPAVPTSLVVIAASTGGPRALAEIVPALTLEGAAVVIAQHMPAGFTESLARRLAALSSVPVTEAHDGATVRPGSVYVAPGGLHTTIDVGRDRWQLAVRAGPPHHGVAPAADRLFTSAAALGARAVAVVLTGMGQDGAEGARQIRRAGGWVITQDAATSIVYGMPQAALAIAGTDAVVPLGEIAAAIHLALASRRDAGRRETVLPVA